MGVKTFAGQALLIACYLVLKIAHDGSPLVTRRVAALTALPPFDYPSARLAQSRGALGPARPGAVHRFGDPVARHSGTHRRSDDAHAREKYSPEHFCDANQHDDLLVAARMAAPC